jgi:chromosome partitioning protein
MKHMTRKTTATIERPRKRVTFRFEAEQGGDVRLAGSFNNWDTEALPLTWRKGSGLYSATLLLPAGRHEYKFIVNGEWRVDPQCPETTSNTHGSHNSVIEF